MHISEDYFITIEGTMESDGDEKPETISLLTRGSFMVKNDTFYITYKESEATGYEGCTTTVKVSKDCSRAAMLRYGDKPSQLIIQKGVRHLCHYETGFGAFTLGVAADTITHELTEQGGHTRFSYTLDSGNDKFISRNTVDITVRPCSS